MWQLTMHRSSHKATPVSTSNVLRLASAATEFRRFHLHTTCGANLSCRNRNPSQRLHRVCKNSGLIFGVSGILGPCWRPFVVHSTPLDEPFFFEPEVEISPPWIEKLSSIFGLHTCLDVLKFVTSPCQKPEVYFRRLGRHLENRHDVITLPWTVPFEWNLKQWPRIRCRSW